MAVQVRCWGMAGLAEGGPGTPGRLTTVKTFFRSPWQAALGARGARDHPALQLRAGGVLPPAQGLWHLGDGAGMAGAAQPVLPALQRG